MVALTDDWWLDLNTSLLEFWFNDSVLSANGSSSSSSADDDIWNVEPAYWCLFLLVFPVCTVFGNVLVCVSVYQEKALHTVTNYFIVSLAIADIMVAVLVMPFAVYVEMNGSVWKLGDAMCDMWVAFDVLCCTSSILNLTAISVDRFIAVTRPIQYAKHRNSRRVNVTLALTWVVSVVVSMPIMLGMNYTPRRAGTPWVCVLYNPDYIMFSSMTSFYVPCVLMIFLYWRTFRAINERAKKMATTAARKHRAVEVALTGTGNTRSRAVNADVDDDAEAVNGAQCEVQDKQRSATTSVVVHAVVNGSGVKSTCTPATPILAENHHHTASLTDYQTLQLDPAAQADADHPSTATTDADVVDGRDDDGTTEAGAAAATAMTTTASCSKDEEESGVVRQISQRQRRRRRLTVVQPLHDQPSSSRRRSARTASDTKRTKLTSPITGSALRMRRSAIFAFGLQRIVHRPEKLSTKRERKATQTLAIVLGVFLLCWVPFFSINIVNAVCIRYDLFMTSSFCNIHPMAFSLFVWLGYINSFLNPLIYTIFNVEFRKAFKKLLLRPLPCCRR